MIDWEVRTEGSRKYWKIIRVRNITEAYQVFEDMLKGFDREDLVTLWSLVKERFRSAEPTEDKERALWVELKRLFEPYKDDVLWKLQRYMYDPLTWRLYGTCGVHHVSSTRGHDIYMLIEKDYPLDQHSSWHRPLALSLNFYDHVNPVTRRTIDQSAGGKLRDLNTEESCALLEDLALYDNESWNNPRDFAKPAKVIALPQDVPSTFDRRLIELKNQVQHLMEAYLTLTQPTQVNKVTTSCEICSGPHDTQYCMEDPE
ncbi:hypothetical protein Tco_0368199 [Tanacetum coccineum]